MCAGPRLGCKDPSGSNDYFLLLFFKNAKKPQKQKPRYYSSVLGLTQRRVQTRDGGVPGCRVRLSFCKAGSAGHHPVPMDRGSTGLMSRHPCSSKKPAEGSAVVEADTGLNYSPQALLKITRSFRMQDLSVLLQDASCLSFFYPCLMFS